jgi:hypothetical protein
MMSAPDRHNRQDGQIDNLRILQICLRVVSGIALVAATVFAAIYAREHGFALLAQRVGVFLAICCLIPVALALAAGLLLLIASLFSRKRD